MSSEPLTEPAEQHGWRAWPALLKWSLACGIALLCLVLSGLYWMGRSTDGHHFANEGKIARNGQWHDIQLARDGQVVLWVHGTDARGCRARAEGERLPVRATDGTRERPGGDGGDWIADSIFDTPTTTVQVKCPSDGSVPPDVVYAESKSRIPAFVDKWGIRTLPLFFFGLVALVCFAGAVLAFGRDLWAEEDGDHRS